jgi:hypothetical protein
MSRTRRPAVLVILCALTAALSGCGRGGDPSAGPGAAAKTPAGPPRPEAGWDVAPAGREWKYIVVHHSAYPSGSYDSIHKEHATRKDRNGKPWEGCGYHFVIGNGNGSRDGQIEVGFRWVQQKQGAHAGSSAEQAEYNQHGIGICLIGNFTVTEPTPAQMDALAKLVGWLAWKNGIPRERIFGHGHIKNSDCPGKNFSFAALFDRLDAMQIPATPQQPVVTAGR